MSTQAMILMIFLFLLITVCVVFTIRKLLSGKEAQRKEYHNQRKNILVQNGIDVKKQMLGSGKGEYFSGNLREYDTNYVNGPIYSTWKISFQNLATGRIYQYRFRKQLQIGRVPVQNSDACLVLDGDSKVSKRHCIVYEGEGRLCLADQNSSNHTYVNGTRVKAPVFLNTGDVIKVGDTKLRAEFGK
ncbi:FHA domain-containing protein [Faecalicatena sp. AGMB00832]|uniref:FHA domain-containing protein n=1 Tax=Faecalicatena faecalis TaxID=2726362 RepID=A0ABS6D643_9FIRM|nr:MULTISPECIES: FHA domain-containing protein [Faecalicatena]MBU3876611.1 FHA domain-containing protein [Faecalicatena faecalis]MCI6464656.1 FHA domain-containing protein [Faecalicatena sp.]MDY5618234.1 FHA domain-containing protein [Lachnospiraceae bacterium]